MVSSSTFDVNQYLIYENDKQQHIFDRAYDVRYAVGFLFSNKYDTIEKHPWGGKGGIVSKLRNDINIPDGKNSLIICGIMKEVLLEKAGGIKF